MILTPHQEAAMRARLPYLIAAEARKRAELNKILCALAAGGNIMAQHLMRRIERDPNFGKR